MINYSVSAPVSEERIRWIDILKALGLILVMIFHIHDTWFLNDYLRCFFISIFFFAGGCVYRERDILQDLKHRARTLVVPYFVFGVLILIYWIVLERRFRPSASTPGRALVGLLLGEFKLLDFHSHLWFLPCYFSTSVLYNALRVTTGKKGTSIAVLILSLLYAFGPLLGCRLPDLPWGLDRVCQYILSFALGAALRESAKQRSLRKLSPTLCIPLGLAALALGYSLCSSVGEEGFMWFVCGMLGTAGCALLSFAFERTELIARPAERIAVTAIVTLCVHGPVYRILIKLLSMLMKTDTLSVRASFLLCCLVLITTLLICMLLYRLIVRCAPWIIGKTVRSQPENA